MPYYYKRPRYYRPRRAWRRRFRAPIRRRLWRRKYYHRRRFYKRVRPRKKLLYLPVKQYQPRYIRKLMIKGIIPLYCTTSARISNNIRLYEDVPAPHYVPSLGGFSITTFSLEAFYELFQRGRCWWTQSNDELQLIRYTGASLKLFRSESSDYIATYHLCPQMEPTIETYNATQPMIQLLNKNHKIVQCKKHNYKRKPYTKIKVKPPSEFTNQWFFQQDLANKPLLFLMCSGMSLDRFYMSSNSISTTIGFTGLNLDFFKRHDFFQTTTQGYFPQDGCYLYTYQQVSQRPLEINQIKIGNLIFLGSTNTIYSGITLGDYSTLPNNSWNDTTLRNYFTNSGNWGNIFVSTNLKGLAPIIFSKQHPRSFITTANYASKDTMLKPTDFHKQTIPFLNTYRYNPFPDDGVGNKIYFLGSDELADHYDPPKDTSLQNNNLPLWLGLFGMIDFFKLKKTADVIDTKKFIILQCKYINPPHKYILPLDDDFLNGKSPYRPLPGDITGSDATNWHPKTSFQYQTCNNICTTGPGTLKLPSNTSAEAHVLFKFYFKLGGCSPPSKSISDPENMPKTTESYNILQPNSLQSPTTPLEKFLYSFDWRRGYLTQKATARISADESTEKNVFGPTGFNLFNPQPTQDSSEETETEEKSEKETLQILLKQLRQQQHRYRQRIIKLIAE
nr:MAG: ORF1 [TTV-like mini virus]